MAVMALLWLLGAGCATEHAASHERRLPVVVRVMTWNIHHGEGLDGVVDLKRIAQLIREEDPDVVALQEVDRGVSRTDGRDMPGELASLTGMTCVFSNNYFHGGGEYGNAVLTRLPVSSWTNSHFRMLSPVEQRGVLQTRLRVGERHIVFMNTHLDAQRDDRERLNETAQLVTLSQASLHEPVILCGDFNATPDHPVSEALRAVFRDAWAMAGQGRGATVPVERPSRRIDYIWMSKTADWTVREIGVLRSDASDHLPVIAEVELR